MFAIVSINGKQYKVSPDQSFIVEHMDGQEGDTVDLTDVLLVNSDTGMAVGTPIVKGVTVKAKITRQGKGEKISVRRYKQKVRYRKARGFRPLETTLQVLSIGHA